MCIIHISEIKDTHVKVEKENTIYTISCSASVIRSKLEGGKNKENMSKLFESIFKETEKGNFATLVMPLEDLIESTTAGKFVKYFLNDFQTNISRKAYKHIPEIVFQVCNRSKFLTLSAAAAAFLTPSPGQESKSKTRKVPGRYMNI